MDFSYVHIRYIIGYVYCICLKDTIQSTLSLCVLCQAMLLPMPLRPMLLTTRSGFSASRNEVEAKRHLGTEEKIVSAIRLFRALDSTEDGGIHIRSRGSEVDAHPLVNLFYKLLSHIRGLRQHQNGACWLWGRGGWGNGHTAAESLGEGVALGGGRGGCKGQGRKEGGHIPGSRATMHGLQAKRTHSIALR